MRYTGTLCDTDFITLQGIASLSLPLLILYLGLCVGSCVGILCPRPRRILYTTGYEYSSIGIEKCTFVDKRREVLVTHIQSSLITPSILSQVSNKKKKKSLRRNPLVKHYVRLLVLQPFLLPEFPRVEIHRPVVVELAPAPPLSIPHQRNVVSAAHRRSDVS